MPNHNPNAMILHSLYYDRLGKGALMMHISTYHAYYDVESKDVKPIHIPVEREGVSVPTHGRTTQL